MFTPSQAKEYATLNKQLEACRKQMDNVPKSSDNLYEYFRSEIVCACFKGKLETRIFGGRGCDLSTEELSEIKQIAEKENYRCSDMRVYTASMQYIIVSWY